MMRRCLLLLLSMLSLCLVWPGGGAVLAQDSPQVEDFVVHSLSQEDLDGDGQPDLTVIEASFSSEGDRVLVYDGASDMVSSNDWHQATDFENDVWVFDVGADGRAELIIIFATDGQQHMATLYDDRDGDEQVKYEVRGKQVVVEESSFWTVRVVADSPWYNADGSINRNVTISADGAVGERGLDFTPAQELMVNDGRVDLEMECHTGTWQEMQAYCLTRLLVSFPGGIMRTKLRAAIAGESLPEIAGAVFWPHLGPGLGQSRSGHEIVPALKMDWVTARFDPATGVNNLILPDPPAQNGWWALSQVPVVKGQVNELNFENPFAHYDLAGDHDGSPALVIRHAYSPPGNLWYRTDQGLVSVLDPRVSGQFFRYTWDQDNDGFWDYKLSLTGLGEVTTTVSFPDFDIVSIPYARLPWVVTDGERWAGVTFVQVESQSESSREGVYAWDGMAWLSNQRIFGIGDRMDEGIGDINVRFRGDYWVGAPQQARLYMSSVDHKLHLFGAEAGVWNVDGTHRIRYEDLNEDGYVDQWVVTTQTGEEAPEEAMKSLQAARDMLLYGGSDRVVLLHRGGAPSLFETLPPRDHAEWQALGTELERYGLDVEPLAIENLLDQFGGPTMEISEAQLEDFRLTTQGFRFVLHLLPGFAVTGDLDEPVLSSLSAGSHLITYDGTFRAQPLTPPHITLPPAEFLADPASPTQLSWTTIKATLHNTGLRDAKGLMVRLYVAMNGGEPYLLAESRVAVQGESTHTLRQAWAPRQPGQWTVWLEVDPGEVSETRIELDDLPHLSVDVAPATMPEYFTPWQSFDGVRVGWPVVLLLGSISLAAAVVVLAILHHAGPLEADGGVPGQDTTGLASPSSQVERNED